jgi:ribosome biogenesis GTPase
MQGKIIGHNYADFDIFSQGNTFHLKAVGKLRFRDLSPLVGDIVSFNLEKELIEDILPRKNELIRPHSANVDQIFVLISLKEPDFSYYLAYLYLSYAFFLNIPVTLILTKKDLLLETEVKSIEEHFKKEGFAVYAINNSNSNLEVIHDLLKGKTTILMGQTGVGKSSLINELFPSIGREIGEYSKRGGRGKHMTKEVRFFPIDTNSFIADTPGFSSFELPISREDFVDSFPPFHPYQHQCFFNDCNHINSKNCAIEAALRKGEISAVTYDNYVKIYNSLEKQRKW